MELPRTRPTGRKPTSLTSRNSLTDRSEVKMAPGRPGRSSASRRMASCGTPCTSRSVPCCSVIALLGFRLTQHGSGSWTEPDPRGLAPLRVQRHYGQWRPRGARPAEMSDRGAYDRGLHDMVFAALLHGAFVLADAHLHVLQHHAVGTVPDDVPLELMPGVVPGRIHQVGETRHFRVTCTPAALAHRDPVVVPGADRDAENQTGRHPARQDQLGEVLSGEVRRERLPQPHAAGRPDRSADGPELQAARREVADGQPDSDDAVPAEFGALRGHPGDRGATGLVHGLHQGPVTAHRAAAGCHRDAGVRHRAEHAEPAVAAGVGRTSISAGVTDVVDGSSEHLAHRLESSAPDGTELVGGQRRSPGTALPDLCHPGLGGRRQAAAGIDGHYAPPCRAVHRSPHDTRRAPPGSASCRSSCRRPRLASGPAPPTPRCDAGLSPVRSRPPGGSDKDQGGPCRGSRAPARPRGAAGRTTSSCRRPCPLEFQIMPATLQPGRISPPRSVPAIIDRPEYVGQRAPRLGEADIKDAGTIERMRAAGRIAAQALAEVGARVAPGVSTDELDRIGHEFLLDHGAYPSTLGYRGFPKSLCTSLNEVICHGIPDDTVIADGDIVNIDITAYIGGVHGDTNATFLAGDVDEESRLLVERTREALMRGIRAVAPGRPLNAIGRVIESYARRFGYGVVRDFTGHGIGRTFHSGLVVPHFDDPSVSVTMEPGMTFTIEPMLTLGTIEYDIWPDGWTVLTADRKRTAQFEHTIAVTNDGYEILTLP